MKPNKKFLWPGLGLLVVSFLLMFLVGTTWYLHLLMLIGISLLTLAGASTLSLEKKESRQPSPFWTILFILLCAALCALLWLGIIPKHIVRIFAYVIIFSIPITVICVTIFRK